MRLMIASLVLLVGTLFSVGQPLEPCGRCTAEPAGCECKPCKCGDNCLCALRAAYVQVNSPREDGKVLVGSGCVITIKGKLAVLTARHVVADAAATVTVRKTVGKITTTWQAAEVVMSESTDLAVIYLKDATGLKPVSMGKPRPFVQGEPCDVFHTTANLHGGYDDPRVHSTEAVEGSVTLNCHCSFGSSGASVFTRDRVLIGVISRAASTDPRAPTICVDRASIDQFIELLNARP